MKRKWEEQGGMKRNAYRQSLNIHRLYFDKWLYKHISIYIYINIRVYICVYSFCALVWGCAILVLCFFCLERSAQRLFTEMFFRDPGNGKPKEMKRNEEEKRK